MRILIAEDDYTSRRLMQKLLTRFGEVDIAANGKEAVDAFRAALDAGEPFGLVCLDIMMPEMDGHATLSEIRALEASRGALAASKIIMTTALDEPGHVLNAFREQCDAYLVKPISHAKLLEHLGNFGIAA